MDPSAIANYPAMTPPAGVIPNFVNPYSLAPSGKITIYVTLPLMVIVLALRIYTRVFITRTMGADDYLCIAAAAGVVSYCGVALKIFSGGYLGPHQWNVPLVSITPDYIQGAIIVTCLYSACAMLIKTSLLTLYLRIFRLAKGANVLIWPGIVIIALFYLICIITTAVYCNPNQWPKNGNPIEFLQAQANSNCNHPQLTLSAAQGVFSTLSDFYVLVIPMFFVSGLRISLGRKISICAVFLVGSLATACSIVTLNFRFQQRTSEDFSWYSAWNILLGAAELNTGIICGCMPVAFVIFKSAVNKPWSSLKTYLQERRSRQNGISAEIDGPDPALAGKRPSDLQQQHQHQYHYGLPKVPGGVMTGLRTFVRSGRSGHEGPRSTVQVQTEMSLYSTYNDVGSVDEEYHRQLKNSESRESSTRLTNNHHV